MSLKRISRAQLPRLAGPACVLLLGLGGAVGCSAYPTLRDVPINCSVEAEYEFDPNNPVALSAWCSGDTTPDASATTDSVDLINGEGPCGSNSALVLRTSHNNDWGSTCGFNNFAIWDATKQITTPRDESAYEGLSFWARAPGNTDKGFTISLYDANDTAYDPNTPGGRCKEYKVDGGTQGQTIVALTDPSTGQTISGAATASRMPDECGNNRGNGYDDVMSVTSEWAFYTIPWGRFTQWAYPNRVPNSILTETGPVPGTGLLTNQLFNLGVRPPKEVDFELWMASVRFYRKKGQTAGVDAAAGPVCSGSTGVACPPAKALITDFTYTGGATDSVHFGDSTTFAGTGYVYPTSGSYMVTSDVTQSNWHISGNLGDYSGFGFNFDNCSRVDASAYRGIQFTISGSVPQGKIVTIGMGTLKDTPASDWLNNGHGGDGTVKPGLCCPTSGTNKYDQSTCADAKKDISVTATPTVVKVLWSDFTGGKPEPGVTPTDIISIYWYFPNPTGVGTTAVAPYPVDIVIDDLQFITP